jgi:dipeptidyl aminopeptidase/acylaminoacyl peptidase
MIAVALNLTLQTACSESTESTPRPNTPSASEALTATSADASPTETPERKRAAATSTSRPSATGPLATPTKTVAAEPAPTEMTAHGGNWEVYVMQADGSDLRRPTGEPGVEDYDPSWSPDSAQIVFSLFSETGGRLMIVNADGSALRELIASEFGDSSPSWSPDGSPIAFGRAGDI